MDFWELRSFLSVAETHSIARSAEANNLSPSTINHNISSLESYLGASLVVRSDHNISLTREGQLLYLHTANILRPADELAVLLNENGKDIDGTLSVGASIQGLDSPVNDCVVDFRKRFPSIALRFVSERQRKRTMRASGRCCAKNRGESPSNSRRSSDRLPD